MYPKSHHQTLQFQMKLHHVWFLQENANHSQVLLAAVQFGISEFVGTLSQGWASEPIIRKAKPKH